MTTAVEVFEAQRARLAGIAYGMLGTRADAEDVVQDAYLRWHAEDPARIRNAEAFLVTVTTRLAIDRLRSARARREAYAGPWLPEPVVAGDDPSDPSAAVEQAERLSLALLVALERLNPVERAVLLLRDVFDLEYAEIADVVDRSPANCRQIAVRARERVGDAGRAREVSPEQERALVDAFMAAVGAGDLERLTSLLAADATLWSDGGGVVRAARRPILTAPKVARFFLGVAPKAPPGSTVAFARVNGEPGLVLQAPQEGVIGVLAFELAGDAIAGLRYVANPEKLTRVPTRPA